MDKSEDKDLRDYDEEEDNQEKLAVEKDAEEIMNGDNKEPELDSHEDEKPIEAEKPVEAEPFEEEPQEDELYDPEAEKNSTKYLLIAIGFIIALFAVFFVTRFFVESPSGAATTIDDLHQMNLAGKLDDDKGYLYNGFSFVSNDGLWYTQFEKEVNGNNTLFNVPLHYGPRDIEDILVGGEGGVGKNGTVYITFDPTEKNLGYLALSASELSLNLVKAMNIVPQVACTKNETDACFDRPILTCDENNTEDVIYLRQADTPAVVFRGNCIIVQGREEDLTRATDRLILYWYEIMR